MLYGATIGDIVGSRFEAYDYKRKDFEFFNYEDQFTDDAIMTIAIYEAYYGVPDELKIKCQSYLDEKILSIIK